MDSLSQYVDLNHCSQEASFAHDLMSNICGEHRLDTCQLGRLNFHYDGIRLPSKKIAMGMISYGAAVAIHISKLKAYSISLPLEGKQSLVIHGAHYQSNSHQGLIVSNFAEQDLQIEQDCKKLQVVIPEVSMQMVLSDLLNQKIETPIIFNPQMELDHQQLLKMWWTNIENFLQFKKQHLSHYGLHMFAQDYENFMIKSLLLSHEHNFSDVLKAYAQHVIPEHIVKVRHYLMMHAQEQIGIEDIIRATGVSKSKLYAEFQHYYRMSPMLYLKKYRLQKIHDILVSNFTQPKLSISQLAFQWGFNHLGRFSQDYKHEFGESPSETKNRIFVD